MPSVALNVAASSLTETFEPKKVLKRLPALAVVEPNVPVMAASAMVAAIVPVINLLFNFRFLIA